MPRRALALAALLTLPALAGCLSLSGGPAPSLAAAMPRARCLQGPDGTSCNLWATTSPAQRQGNEVAIAVNPTNPGNVIALAKDYTQPYAGNCVWDGSYATHDGGRTWKDGNFPGSPWARLRDPTEPVTPLSTFWCLTDPSVAFGPDGTAYAAVMGYQCDPVSASPTPIDVPGVPPVNDFAFTCSGMYVAMSHDGGDTWPDIATVTPLQPGLTNDKEWIAVDPRSGNVYLVWDYYVSGAVDAPSAGPIGGYVAFAASRDKGKTWDTLPTFLNQENDGGVPQIAIGPKGEIAVAWLGDHTINFTISTDEGRSWAPEGMAANITPLPDLGKLNNTQFRVNSFPTIAFDASDGPRRGTIYLAWADARLGDADIFLTWSADLGRTWAAPVRANDDPERDGKDQFHPAIAVGPHGDVDLAFYDRRYDPLNTLLDLTYATTRDPQDWSRQVRVTEVSSDSKYSHHQGGFEFIGDYIDIDSNAQCAWPAWVDTRHQKADVFTACMERGPAPG